MKQLKLKIDDKNLPRKGSLARKLVTMGVYGGDIRYRKLKRPLSNQKPIHTVFKMTDVAFKKSSGFRKETAYLNKTMFLLCRKFHIKNYRHAINGNHIHLICKIGDKKSFGRFLRAFSGSVGLYYKLKFDIEGGLWKSRPFTRLVTWGQQYTQVCKYIVKNFKEVVGFVAYTPRNHRNYGFIEHWASTKFISTA